MLCSTALAPSGEADLRAQFAGPLRRRVLTRPSASAPGRPAPSALYESIVAAVDALTAGTAPRAARAPAPTRLAQRRLGQPRGREGSLLRAAAADWALSPTELVANAVVLLFGGIDTTEGMIASASRATAHARSADRVRGDRAPRAASSRSRCASSPPRPWSTATPRPTPTWVAPDRRGRARPRLAHRGRPRPNGVRRPGREPTSTGPRTRAHLAFAQGPHVCVGVHLAPAGDPRSRCTARSRPPARPAPWIPTAPRRTRGSCSASPTRCTSRDRAARALAYASRPPALACAMIRAPSADAHVRRGRTARAPRSARPKRPSTRAARRPTPHGEAVPAGHTLPEYGIGMDAAYELISCELLLDGQARLNLATFVTTWMPSTAAQLMAETADKNMIDKDEYPQTARDRGALRGHPGRPLELARARAGDRLLDDRLQRGGDAGRHGAEVALARAARAGRQADRPAQPRDGRQRPGVLGEVLPLLGGRAAHGPDGGRSLPSRRRGGGRAVRREHDRGGGHPRLDLRRQLRAGQGHLPRRWTGWRTRRASTCPSTSTPPRAGSWPRSSQPELEWDFRLPRVQSINASGHNTAWSIRVSAGRCGATRRRCPGAGVQRQLPRRQHADLRAELLAARLEVIAQYYMFAALGREGYRRIMQGAQDIATLHRRARSPRSGPTG